LSTAIYNNANIPVAVHDQIIGRTEAANRGNIVDVWSSIYTYRRFRSVRLSALCRHCMVLYNYSQLSPA